MAATVNESSEADAATPIDMYLAAQADMSSVDRFSRLEVSGRTGKWTDLIPLTNPAEGEQFRFDVDLDLCTGCKACVTACHSLNGLDESESFRSVGLLVGSDVLPKVDLAEPILELSAVGAKLTPQPEPVVNQLVTTACHHCVDPGCLNGCPAKAYEKDPTTGIVKHLDDACIGCEYCTMTCPYEVPVYNKRLGIVRKCDMCSDRLAEGEAPACVQGCPNSAISISIVSTAELRKQQTPTVDTKRLVPGAADSALTTPSTRYRRRQKLPEAAQPVDVNTISPGHGHTPLAVMLVLSQAAVGLHVARAVGGFGLADNQNLISAVLVPAVTAIAIAISVLHLGQPLKAWRAVLGFKHSWLSREVVALSGFFGLSVGSAVAAVQGWSSSTLIDAATSVVGLVTVGCSAMVYGVSGRRWWRPKNVITKFGLTVVCTGLAALSTVMSLTGAEFRSPYGFSLLIGLLIAVVTKLVVEHSVLRTDDAEELRTVQLLKTTLAARYNVRLVLGSVGGILCPLVALAVGSGPIAVFAAVAGLECVVAGELLARSLFFKASSAPTMPGSMR